MGGAYGVGRGMRVDLHQQTPAATRVQRRMPQHRKKKLYTQKIDKIKTKIYIDKEVNKNSNHRMFSKKNLDYKNTKKKYHCLMIINLV